MFPTIDNFERVSKVEFEAEYETGATIEVVLLDIEAFASAS